MASEQFNRAQPFTDLLGALEECHWLADQDNEAYLLTVKGDNYYVCQKKRKYGKILEIINPRGSKNE